MARQHGGDIYDFAHMSDDEIRALVVQQLNDYPNVDAGWIDVQVRDGFVTLSGRVGTDSERRVAESILADVLGLQNYSNDLVLDETHRVEAPEAADEWAAMNLEGDEQIGRPDPNQSDTAEHLIEDLRSQTYGTHDMGEAIQDGIPYIPPDRPVGDGYESTEDH
jgi:hypothetical protein